MSFWKNRPGRVIAAITASVGLGVAGAASAGAAMAVETGPPIHGAVVVAEPESVPPGEDISVPEFHDAGAARPRHCPHSTSAFTIPSPLQQN